MELKNKTILIVSNEPWGDVWYSKHNWAYELSKNNDVYFINPPQKWKFRGLFKTHITFKNYTKTLKILNYNNRLPLTRFNLIFKLNENLIFKSLNAFFKNKKDLIFWSFDPYRLIMPQKLNLVTSIYFIADKYEIKREKILINNVDKIISVSQELTKNIKNKPVLNISHGIRHVSEDYNVERDNSVILMGTFSDRVDYDLLFELVNNIPTVVFYLFGNNTIKEKKNILIFNKIIKMKNVDYKGVRRYSDIVPYMQKAKLGIALYKTNKVNNQLNSLKIIQYLSCGLEVVSTPLNFYRNASEEGILFLTNNKKEYIKKCRQILSKKNDNKNLSKKNIFVKQFLYQRLVLKIEEFLSE